MKRIVVMAPNGIFATIVGWLSKWRETRSVEVANQLRERTLGHFINDNDIFVLLGVCVQVGFNRECVRRNLLKR